MRISFNRTLDKNIKTELQKHFIQTTIINEDEELKISKKFLLTKIQPVQRVKLVLLNDQTGRFATLFSVSHIHRSFPVKT